MFVLLIGCVFQFSLIKDSLSNQTQPNHLEVSLKDVNTLLADLDDEIAVERELLSQIDETDAAAAQGNFEMKLNIDPPPFIEREFEESAHEGDHKYSPRSDESHVTWQQRDMLTWPSEKDTKIVPDMPVLQHEWALEDPFGQATQSVSPVTITKLTTTVTRYQSQTPDVNINLHDHPFRRSIIKFMQEEQVKYVCAFAKAVFASMVRKSDEDVKVILEAFAITVIRMADKNELICLSKVLQARVRDVATMTLKLEPILFIKMCKAFLIALRHRLTTFPDGIDLLKVYDHFFNIKEGNQLLDVIVAVDNYNVKDYGKPLAMTLAEKCIRVLIAPIIRLCGSPQVQNFINKVNDVYEKRFLSKRPMPKNIAYALMDAASLEPMPLQLMQIVLRHVNTLLTDVNKKVATERKLLSELDNRNKKDTLIQVKSKSIKEHGIAWNDQNLEVTDTIENSGKPLDSDAKTLQLLKTLWEFPKETLSVPDIPEFEPDPFDDAIFTAPTTTVKPENPLDQTSEKKAMLSFMKTNDVNYFYGSAIGFLDMIMKKPYDLLQDLLIAFRKTISRRALESNNAVAMNPEIREVLLQYDSLFNDEEGDELLDSVVMLHKYSRYVENYDEHAAKLIKRFIDAALAPTVRLCGSYQLKTLIAEINQVYRSNYPNAAVRNLNTTDARNHGDSPHDSAHSYLDLAADVSQLLQTLSLPQSHIIGHSMGGRTGMALALNEPTRVQSLIVVDVSPIIRSPNPVNSSVASLIAAMKKVNFQGTDSGHKARSKARKSLVEAGFDKRSLDFILMSIHERPDKTFAWKYNLDALANSFNKIATFPDELKRKQYTGPTLFIGGGKSDYIRKSDEPAIKELFPQSSLTYIEHVGHNAHFEDPPAFLKIVLDFYAKHL
ncbi:unnamed protein product [Arctia plantaginis]|uniref:sn-1-specific diacylglycerol lipase ABHD11 n=1 Tax=Arctia plantaginis TaxID=874455 RepID=A0A8S0YLK0_ARCPL|nr:unnamed protein product [Arctia plantaginis]